MAEDLFIFDAVGHAYDFSDANRVESFDPLVYDKTRLFLQMGGHSPFESLAPGCQLSPAELATRWNAEELAHAFFVESDVDMVAYHHVEMAGICKGGVSRWDTGVELKRLAPHRVVLYGGVDVFSTDRAQVFDDMARMAEEGAQGFKFYPSTMLHLTGDLGRLPYMLYDDPDGAYPYFEKARALGVRHLAFHKTQPVGPGTVGATRVGDLSNAAMDFPDMTFEVVHDGYAFLEECALQLGLYQNIYANLETTANMAVRQPRKFAEILGTLLQNGGPQRLLFATGCCINHVDPILQTWRDFEMPAELVEGWGMPPLTPEFKRMIMGENMAQLHGIDIAERRKLIAEDEWTKLRAEGKREPWAERRKWLAEHPEQVQQVQPM